jgi:hypothetical protein
MIGCRYLRLHPEIFAPTVRCRQLTTLEGGHVLHGIYLRYQFDQFDYVDKSSSPTVECIAQTRLHISIVSRYNLSLRSFQYLGRAAGA